METNWLDDARDNMLNEDALAEINRKEIIPRGQHTFAVKSVKPKQSVNEETGVTRNILDLFLVTEVNGKKHSTWLSTSPEPYKKKIGNDGSYSAVPASDPEYPKLKDFDAKFKRFSELHALVKKHNPSVASVKDMVEALGYCTIKAFVSVAYKTEEGLVFPKDEETAETLQEAGYEGRNFLSNLK